MSKKKDIFSEYGFENLDPLENLFSIGLIFFRYFYSTFTRWSDFRMNAANISNPFFLYQAFAKAFMQKFSRASMLLCCNHQSYSNRKKRDKKIPSEYCKEIMRDIDKLHRGHAQPESDELLNSTFKKWLFESELPDLYWYFKKQWIDSKFSNWQIFCSPTSRLPSENLR